MNKFLKIILPFAVLLFALGFAWKMISSRPQVETRPPEVVPPLVRVLKTKMESLQFTVEAQGTVVPRTETSLAPEVSGKVIFMSPSLAVGGFFEKGDVLLKLDPTDYELAIIRSKSQIAQAEMILAREKAEAEVALKEWQDLGRGEPSALVRREPQMAEAQAALSSAHSSLAQAETDIERAVIKAPFAGRVRSKNVDIGQFVTRGSPIATLYSVDFAEVPLPLPDEELAFIDLPLSYRGEDSIQKGPITILRADFAGRQYSWRGRIVRTEGEIDPQTRMIQVVAQVADPYSRGQNPDRPPLAVGMFVNAEIQGKRAEKVILLPPAALYPGDRVLVVDADDRLHFREVEVIRREKDKIVVGSGLQAGELVSLSPLDTPTEGMKVRTVLADEENADQSEGVIQ